ncbi:hypothetical protein JCGZ_26503 [Jatropha curcas]|uniref:Uncharacterized protein n=1 Tax=Jatropha curcas TaxID=180498 RepID=A0A067JYW1_JATCU|nr:hypothetical protein JCGZ_26503 [Jatropha curcas]
MAQVPEIPASAYTPEMETMGVIPDIPVFEGDRIPVSRNALNSGTRPLQFLPVPGSNFSIRYNTDAMCGFQSEMRHAMNTQILRLKKPVFPECKQSGWTGGHSESSPKVCQYGT